MAIIQGSELTHLKKNEEGFWEAPVKITSNKICLYAKLGEGNQYIVKIKYEGN